jgi:osmotically inducible protein OsmC
MAISKASAYWNGSLKDGRGSMKPAHAPEIPFSLSTRFEGASGSNPEELIGAALCGCFSMALALALERAGHTPRSIQTAARVSMDKEGDGFRITKIELTTDANVPGAERGQFETIAEETKRSCPVSRALGNTTITLKANLD